MIAPAHPPSFFPHPFQPYGDALSFWPQAPLDGEQEPASQPEFQPSKKPRSSENVPLNVIQNPQNPTLNTRVLPQNNTPVNRGISRIFFKTRMCEKFKQGICPYSNNCNFAHGAEELRKPPPNWKHIVAAHEDERGIGNWAEQQRLINRLRICRKYFYGEGCPYGDKCNFVHEDSDSLRERESGATLVLTNANWLDYVETNDAANFAPDIKPSNAVVNSVADYKSSSAVVNLTPDSKPAFWKTKMCNKWETTGHCPFGEKCHFAHGLGELQKFGGFHADAENGNAVVAVSKLLPAPGNYISPSNITAPSCKRQACGIKSFTKWNGTKLISRVYADWIDNVQPFKNSPGKSKC